MDIWHFYNNEYDMRKLLNKIEEIIHLEYNTKIVDLYYNIDNNEWLLVLDNYS